MGKIFAALYDRMMASAERKFLGERRKRVAAGARGRVLELGAGTGINLTLYPADQVSELTCTEPDAYMMQRAKARAAEHHLSAAWAETGAEALPFADESFDTVVATLVFCTVPNPAAGLREAHRVLKPGGELRLLEHTRS